MPCLEDSARTIQVVRRLEDEKSKKTLALSLEIDHIAEKNALPIFF